MFLYELSRELNISWGNNYIFTSTELGHVSSDYLLFWHGQQQLTVKKKGNGNYIESGTREIGHCSSL